MHRALWILQGLLALVFVFAGVVKLMMPLAVLLQQMPLPAWVLRSVSASEIAGALGLVLPALLRVRPGLTVLAAAGLAVLMLGATVFTVQHDGAAPAVAPLVLAVCCALVVYGRSRLVPVRPASAPEHAGPPIRSSSAGS
jgi:hypothetical protein